MNALSHVEDMSKEACLGTALNLSSTERECSLVRFSGKWLTRFQRWPSNMLFEEPEFADDCRMMGFEMDSGEAFEEAFPGCFRDAVSTKAAIDSCTDKLT